MSLFYFPSTWNKVFLLCISLILPLPFTSARQNYSPKHQWHDWQKDQWPQKKAVFLSNSIFCLLPWLPGATRKLLLLFSLRPPCLCFSILFQFLVFFLSYSITYAFRRFNHQKITSTRNILAMLHLFHLFFLFAFLILTGVQFFQFHPYLFCIDQLFQASLFQ